MQYNKVGEIMYKILIVEDDELISKKLESIGIVDFIQTKKGLGYKI